MLPVTEGIQEVTEDPLQELSSLLTPVLNRAECSYLDEDWNLETGDLPTDDDILAILEGGLDDNDNDDDDGPEEDHTASIPPTSQQAMEAAIVLQYYFDNKNDEEGSWAVVGIQNK